MLRLLAPLAGQGAPVNVLYHGTCEPLKRSVHRVMEGTALVCLLYNAAAWLKRRETHLAVNVVIYTAIVVLEDYVCARHKNTPVGLVSGNSCCPVRERGIGPTGVASPWVH